MPDPLSPPKQGQSSPFLTSFNTADKSLSLLRDLDRAQGRGRAGGEVPPLPDLPPATRILVQNNSGADLAAFRVLALGTPLTSIEDSDSGSLAFARHPAFPGTTPTATTDAFCITDEPAPYIAGGNSPLVTAVVQGVVPVDVNVTDSGHGYATPTASDNTKLTSASSGPARILYKPAGTGTLRCVVKLDESAAAAASVSISHDQQEFSGSYSVMASDAWEDTGLTLSLPSAGTYFLFGRFRVSAQVSVISGNPFVYTRLYDSTNAAEVTDTAHVALLLTDPDMAVQTANGSVCTVHTVAGAASISAQIRRNSGSTWVTTVFNGAPGGALPRGSHMGYLKIG